MGHKLDTDGPRLSEIFDLGLLSQILRRDVDAPRFDGCDLAKLCGEMVAMEGIGWGDQAVEEPTSAADARSTKSLSLGAHALDQAVRCPS